MHEFKRFNDNRREVTSKATEDEAEAYALRTGKARAAKPEAEWDSHRRKHVPKSLEPLARLPRDLSSSELEYAEGELRPVQCGLGGC
mmetsp:Transcript_42/g.87  ORF Transcript_42/g.87 Transcript_42/m.87 type:complete len:87 (-) Transcript_42:309-569(-)